MYEIAPSLLHEAWVVLAAMKGSDMMHWLRKEVQAIAKIMLAVTPSGKPFGYVFLYAVVLCLAVLWLSIRLNYVSA